MFAALTVPRLIEAIHLSSTEGTPSLNLSSRASWQSPDDVPADELPLAKACQKVLASMQHILGNTAEKCEAAMREWDSRAKKEGCGSGDEDAQDRERRRHLALMNASEVKVVRHVYALVHPPDLERFKPRKVEEGEKVADEVGQNEPDQFGVMTLGLGKRNEGAIQVMGESDQKNVVGEDKGRDSVKEAEQDANKDKGPKKQEPVEEQRPEEQMEGHMAEEEQRPDGDEES